MPEPITVLGIGNPIMSDDGVGLEILEQLRAHYTDQQHLEFVDGGTSGMELLPTIQDAESTSCWMPSRRRHTVTRGTSSC